MTDLQVQMTPTTRKLDVKPLDGDALMVHLAGTWRIAQGLPSTDGIEHALEAHPRVKRLLFDTGGLKDWDSGLLTFLVRLEKQCKLRNIRVEKDGLPQGVVKLLDLASAVPKKETYKKSEDVSFITALGKEVLDFWNASGEMLAFIGEATIAFLRLLVGKARFRLSDLFVVIEECSAQALPIVSLISVLVGLILAFVGAVQLQMFGAQIYVANLVGLAMAREMGAIMTGVIMAGRTGAAFAAQLGTMQVNEEIDALKTLGIAPMEFLVLPRMLALVLMMPLLCIYANFMGILGGILVAVGMLDIPLAQYLEQTRSAVTLMDFSIGVFKGAVFGVLVALSGCLRGMQCGRSSAAVGVAATSAVVTAIVCIITSDALMTVITNVLGI